ncbi:MAG: hypothetical protein RBS43_02395 [Candidatus Cloacimonas sp.]|jgi:V/A-type H+-transporting ATPase subunit E|nr:hypothetical protein [Candidatus Cloacimonas sp.]
MNDQLQDLLTRVYEEGVAKANAEAERIISDAKSKAEVLLAQAYTDSEAKLKEADKIAADLKKNTNSDLLMATNHSLSAVKQKVTELILSQSLNVKINEVFSETEFMKKLILEAVNGWKSKADSGTIVISDAMRPKLDDYFLKSLKDIFAGKLSVDFSPTMKNGFMISPADGTYKLSFSDEDFANLFKSYLRPRTKEILFGN